MKFFVFPPEALVPFQFLVKFSALVLATELRPSNGTFVRTSTPVAKVRDERFKVWLVARMKDMVRRKRGWERDGAPDPARIIAYPLASRGPDQVRVRKNETATNSP